MSYRELDRLVKEGHINDFDMSDWTLREGKIIYRVEVWFDDKEESVSYTHLTLPTILRV